MCSADPMWEQAAWAWGFLCPLRLGFRPAPGGAFGCKYPPVETSREEEGGLAGKFLPGSLTVEFSIPFPVLCVQFSVLLPRLPAQPQRGLQWEGGWETASFPFLVLWNASSKVALLF